MFVMRHCLCCSLRASSMTLAILTLVGAGFMFLGACAIAANGDALPEAANTPSENNNPMGGTTLAIILFVFTAIVTFVGVAMLVAIKKEKPLLLIPFIVMGAIEYILSFFAVVGLIAFAAMSDDTFDEMGMDPAIKSNLAVPIILFIIIFVLQLTSVFSVWCYYKQMKHTIKERKAQSSQTNIVAADSKI